METKFITFTSEIYLKFVHHILDTKVLSGIKKGVSIRPVYSSVKEAERLLRSAIINIERERRKDEEY